MGVQIIQKEQDIGESITTQELDVELMERVDSYGELTKELADAEAEIAPLKKKVADLKKSLLAEGEEADGTDIVTLHGADYVVELGKCANKVVAIDKEQLKKTLGDDTFFELADVSVTDIRKYCTPPQLEKILAEEKIGVRRVTVEAK